MSRPAVPDIETVIWDTEVVVGRLRELSTLLREAGYTVRAGEAADQAHAWRKFTEALVVRMGSA